MKQEFFKNQKVISFSSLIQKTFNH